MADALTGINSFLETLQLNFGNPIGLASNLILSTIVGGIVMLVVIEIFAKKFSAEVNPLHAFLIVLVISIINIFGIVPILGSMLSMLPFAGLLIMILPILVWIILVKVFFRDLEMLHVLIIGVLGYFISLYVIPYLVSMVSGFIPI